MGGIPRSGEGGGFAPPRNGGGATTVSGRTSNQRRNSMNIKPIRDDDLKAAFQRLEARFQANGSAPSVNTEPFKYY